MSEGGFTVGESVDFPPTEGQNTGFLPTSSEESLCQPFFHESVVRVVRGEEVKSYPREKRTSTTALRAPRNGDDYRPLAARVLVVLVLDGGRRGRFGSGHENSKTSAG